MIKYIYEIMKPNYNYEILKMKKRESIKWKDNSRNYATISFRSAKDYH